MLLNYIVKFLLLCIVVISTVSARADEAVLPCGFFDAGGPKVKTRLESDFITGAELEIPRDYVKSFAFEDGGVRDALLLSVWRDSFMPYTRRHEISREQRQRYRDGHRDQMDVLVDPGNPLNVVAGYAVNFEYGKSVLDPNPDLEGVLLPNGLYGQQTKALRTYSDVYLGRQGNHITDIIRCAQRGDVPYPNCTHRFEVDAYHLDIDYPLEALDRWKFYRDRAAAMIMCFTIKMPTRLDGE